MFEFKVLFYSRTLCKYFCVIYITASCLSKDDIATSFKRQFIILTLNKTLTIQNLLCGSPVWCMFNWWIRKSSKRLLWCWCRIEKKKVVSSVTNRKGVKKSVLQALLKISRFCITVYCTWTPYIIILLLNLSVFTSHQILSSS